METEIQKLPDTDVFWEESDKAIIFSKDFLKKKLTPSISMLYYFYEQK